MDESDSGRDVGIMTYSPIFFTGWASDDDNTQLPQPYQGHNANDLLVTQWIVGSDNDDFLPPDPSQEAEQGQHDKCYDTCTSDKCYVYHVFVSFMYRVGL